MSEKTEIIRVFNTPKKDGESRVATAAELRLMIGDTVIDGVYSVDIEKIEPDGVIKANICVLVRLGDS